MRVVLPELPDQRHAGDRLGPGTRPFLSAAIFATMHAGSAPDAQAGHDDDKRRHPMQRHTTPTDLLDPIERASRDEITALQLP